MKGKKLTRQEMIDTRVILYKGVHMNKYLYESYRKAGYGDGVPWDELIIHELPQCASDEAFECFYAGGER